MDIIFEDGSRVGIEFNDSPLTLVVKNMYKHLKHVPIPFQKWDNPYFYKNIDYPGLVDHLARFGASVGVTVDVDRCLAKEQGYFNELHKIYEQHFDGNPAWLSYHEHIHFCELYHKQILEALYIDYREKAGMLEKKFDTKWLTDSVTSVMPGMVFISWAELGKVPYGYWRDGEPSDLERLCQLAKPWLKLRPKIGISIEAKDFMDGVEQDAFNVWWKDFESDWCKHWGLNHWPLSIQRSVNVIGQVTDHGYLLDKLQNLISPVRIAL